MNIIDLASIAILGLFLLGGIYKGFLSTLFSIGSYIVSVLLAFLVRPLIAALVTGNDTLFNMMLYYTEGSEFIVSPEFVRMEVSALSSAEITEIISAARLPYPMGREIASNIATEAFASQGITTLGDYFNQTMVLCFINILAFLAAFCLVRLLFGLVINGIDYAHPFPVLRTMDYAAGAALGLVRGGMALLLIFMLVPIVLTIMGQFDLITGMVDGSSFADVFYLKNFLLRFAA